MQRKSLIIYEGMMLVLIILSLFFAFSNNTEILFYDRIIWGIFVVDYFTRLFLSQRKWEFIKKHPLELIAIIPLDSIFRAARFVRIFLIIRLLGFASRYMKPIYEIVKRNGLEKLLLIATILLFFHTYTDYVSRT